MIFFCDNIVGPTYCICTQNKRMSIEIYSYQSLEIVLCYVGRNKSSGCDAIKSLFSITGTCSFLHRVSEKN